MVSTSFPPLPPGSQNTIIDIVLQFHAVPDRDAVVDLTLGCRNGPGVSRRITLPMRVLNPAVQQYATGNSNPAAKKAGDNHYTKEIEMCLNS
jgi:hypothetical protein